MMAFDDRRKSNSGGRIMWVSLALNLFLIGAIAGSIAAGSTILHRFFEGPLPPFDGGQDRPPPLRMLEEIRDRLSPGGKEVFDAEFGPVVTELMKRRQDVEAFTELREVLLRDNATDEDIRAAFDQLKDGIGRDFTNILNHMANVAVKLSLADRAELALHRPGPPPPPDQ